MTDVFEKISQNTDISSYDTHKTWVLGGIEEPLLDIAFRVLKKLLGQNIRIDVFDDLEGYKRGGVGKGIDIKLGEKFSLTSFSSLGYTRVPRVWEEGEYSVLGDIVTFLPKGFVDVVRISLFGENVEQIALLEPDTRVFLKALEEIEIPGNSPELQRFVGDFDGKRILFFRESPKEEDINFEYVDLGIRTFPGLNRNYLEKVVESYKKQGYQIYAFVKDKEIPEEFKSIEVVYDSLKRGFVASFSKIVVLSEMELFGELDLGDFEKGNKKKGEEIFKQIVPGDYVVHTDHGIGIYEAVVEQFGVMYLDIHYAGNDRLLIPLTAANKLSKYVGSGRGKPTLTGLSSGVWTRIKRKAKEDIEKVAKDLAALYAMRSMSKTKKMINSGLDLESLNSFIDTFDYQDTEDQRVITDQLINDFSRDIPVDRLIVGDVGFGKTELAARATFICANAGFQVAILAPTTVLVSQHFKVLSERFADTPFRIEMLSRAIGKNAREKILQGLRDGKIDIVVGTHSLLSDAVVFKNLGVLIIDEEQKFGVSQKERIKRKKLSVNVISTTATPIPRTLNMAMSGIRDLSILASVPEGRKSIVNRFEKFNWETVIEGIQNEVKRGGQVYYLHNRVKDLLRLKQELEEKITNVKVEIAHGQMGEVALIRVMRDFALNKFDVLLCSTIIENGLDLPNVNTLIVDDAQRYGLSQLYQIRGRIGRSSIQAYAYIMYSSLYGDSKLRLDALKEAHSLGAGFILSNRDLEIRGAGNILGKSQSGAINSIGYALYTQMLEEAIKNVRG